MRFAGKTALVTGASSGIGRACARQLHCQGADLILTGRRRSALASVVERPARMRSIPADLVEPASLESFCDSVLRTTKRLDVLVHCAGVGILAPASETEPREARHLMELNVLAPVEITRRLCPIMGRGAVVAMVSSIAGKVALPGMAVYSASKHALNAYADALRAELSESGVRVVSVCPGFVNTPFGENMLQGAANRRTHGAERLSISPDRCAAAILDGVCNGSRTVVVPRAGWLLIAAERILPTAVRSWMLRHTLPQETS